MHERRLFLLMFAGLAIHAGCAVPQPRGLGQYARVQEPGTQAWYHLYLPEDYVKSRAQHPDSSSQKWPLVVTLHGMKPYDNALPQEREWEEQADIYGYIICAPELHTSDSFMEFPLTQEHEYVLADKRNVLAIMDHVFATTDADSERVLLTSWSCGGYLVHYLANRYPDRFSCIATRLSNFSSKLMMEDNVPLYRDRVPVAIFIGDGDFAACKSESQDAVAWYTARGFRTVDGKMIDRMGHWRIPQTAAAFFAEHMGIQPLHPAGAAKTVATVVMTDYSPPERLVAKFSPGSRKASPPPQDQSQFARTLSNN
jgi:dienelactone hydrolase